MPRLLFAVRSTVMMVVLFFFAFQNANAYSVLTHEALIDASWEKYLKPLLRMKYPGSSDAALLKAHAFAYGGCLVPDLGYFPFGSVYFTNLTHYVRSGDFVESMIAEAHDLNEYAFALGTLCHYNGDRYGHSMGTNFAVPITYPKMKKEFGDVVTYEENHASHSRVEISFDVLETARGNYAAPAYHNFIGFEVSKPILERAFLKTYGMELKSVFTDLDLAIGTFRWSVKSLLPTVTRTAWLIKKDDIKKLNHSANSHNFHYKMSKRAYVKEFGSSRQKPKFGERCLAVLIRILPKVGPLKALKFKDVGPEGEKLFIRSFDTVLVHYHECLAVLQHGPINLQDIDYDTGKPTAAGEYGLADKTYAALLGKLEANKFLNMPLRLRENFLSFYSKAEPAKFSVKYPKDWEKTLEALGQLRNSGTN